MPKESESYMPSRERIRYMTSIFRNRHNKVAREAKKEPLNTPGRLAEKMINVRDAGLDIPNRPSD